MNKAISILALCVLPTISYAHQSGSGDVDASGFADRHAPIGVMGDHRHDAGEWMVSYRYMDMEMQGLKQGDDSIGRQAVASLPGVRVVPREMRMEMHMFGVMYAPSDRVTLMAMANYVEKDMDLVTYQGMSGTEELGDFSTSSRGWGDSSITALIGLLDSVSQNVHLNLGLNLPTGDIKKTDTALTPMGTIAEIRLPYGMQLGSGTFDLEPGVTYTSYRGALSWGGQYRATIRLENNSEDYKLGDRHQVTTWASVRTQPWLSASVRLTYSHEGDIRGHDPRIVAPVTAANPDNYGGERVDFAFGFNIAGQHGLFRGHRLAIEYGAPVYQDVNGVQLESDGTVTFGYQYAF